MSISGEKGRYLPIFFINLRPKKANDLYHLIFKIYSTVDMIIFTENLVVFTLIEFYMSNKYLGKLMNI